MQPRRRRLPQRTGTRWTIVSIESCRDYPTGQSNPFARAKASAAPSSAARGHCAKRGCISAMARPTRAMKRRNWCFSWRGLAHARGAGAYAQLLSARQSSRIDALLKRRIAERIPLAYLTHRAFFAGLELYVDERVLVPRSPIAELVLHRFQPWIAARRVRRVLDIGTGSGAIALACARAFPRARVDAVDISAAALPVCRRNVRTIKTGKARQGAAIRPFQRRSGPPLRYHRQQSALCRARGNATLAARIPARTAARGLASGADGLKAVRAILAAARTHLEDDGILVVEVGNTEARAAARLSAAAVCLAGNFDGRRREYSC